jgi:hypothetical protein
VGAGSAFGFTVKAEDSQGNAATSFTGSVVIALANNPGGSTLGGTLTVSAVNGVAVFSDLTLNNIGSDYTLQATSNGLASATTAAINVQIGTVTVNDTNSGSSDNVGVTFIDATHYNVTVNGVSTTYSTLNDNKFIYDGPTGASSEFIFDDPTGVYSAVQTLSGTTLVNSSGFEADLNNVSTLYVYLTSPGSTATVNVADGGATSSNFYVGAVNGGYSYIANPISHISSFLVGFGNETVTGSGDTTYAYIYSTSQARTVLDPGGSMFAVGGVTTTLNNFPQVYAVGAVDGTDSITLHSEGGTCVGQASFSYAKGTYNGGPFLVGALYAANVTAEATNPTDPAYFYNTESTDTFNGARGTSNLTGVPIGLEVAAVKFTTFVAQAVGFQSINVEEWNPTYNFTNPMGIDNLTSPGNGTFTETSTVSALTVGTSVITVNTYSENSSQQFVAVASQMNVTGAGNGTDMSVLYDAPGTNTLTAGGSTAKLTTPVNTVTVNSFGKVTANQQNSTNDTEQQTAALDFALTMVGNWTNA